MEPSVKLTRRSGPYCEVGKRTNRRNFELEGRIIAERRRRAAAEQGEAW